MRAVGPVLQLWDIDNVEAFVARAVKAGLDARSARLSGAQYDRCFEFCLLKAWDSSGLAGDGKTLRYLYRIRGFIRPVGRLETYTPIKLRPFASERAAELTLASLREQAPVAFARIERFRPGSWYDPSKGAKRFSTYLWRLIVNYRIDDWYRADPEFGDTRYRSNRVEEVSLEELAEHAHRDISDDERERDGWLPVPLGRLEVIDQLNAHHYISETEEVLTREAFGFRG